MHVLNRRDFMQGSAALAAALAGGTFVDEAVASQPAQTGYGASPMNG